MGSIARVFFFFSAAAVLVLTNGCSPGTGPLTTARSLVFDISPFLNWTVKETQGRKKREATTPCTTLSSAVTEADSLSSTTSDDTSTTSAESTTSTAGPTQAEDNNDPCSTSGPTLTNGPSKQQNSTEEAEKVISESVQKAITDALTRAGQSLSPSITIKVPKDQLKMKIDEAKDVDEKGVVFTKTISLEADVKIAYPEPQSSWEAMANEIFMDLAMNQGVRVRNVRFI
ncbi:hypothetical protein QR680_014751 [Steinernema hermaphroditum]|uniref:Uncharacterized protein n=1 Tax=Steinernema hermaphroditum TaxID=289476 RepID=A0AA39I9Z2_9BILA|nr:hypothetical protein QR680_014751 [Steinernema hermaphroditum]